MQCPEARFTSTGILRMERAVVADMIEHSWRDALQEILQGLIDAVFVYMYGSHRTSNWFVDFRSFVLNMCRYCTDKQHQSASKSSMLIDNLRWRCEVSETIKRDECQVVSMLLTASAHLDRIIGKVDDFVDFELRGMRAYTLQDSPHLAGLMSNCYIWNGSKDLPDRATLNALAFRSEVFVKTDARLSKLCRMICASIHRIADHLDMELDEFIFEEFEDGDFAKPDDHPTEDAQSVEDATTA